MSKNWCRISHLTPENESIQLWQKYFRPLMEKTLQEDGMKNLTFVYGDTHEGGWGELKEDDIRIYNCGGWVVHNKDNHPRCHISAVDLDGNEHLLDVSFKTVAVDEKPLLQLALLLFRPPAFMVLDRQPHRKMKS